MRTFEALEAVGLLAVLLVGAPALGAYLHRVYDRPEAGFPRLHRAEVGLYRLLRLDWTRSMGWAAYAGNLCAFSGASVAFLWAILMLQGFLPLNPQGLPGLSWDLALNTAISFVTNTNWQAYAGESSLSYLSQMLGLTAQNFLSAGVGMSVAVALIRGLRNRSGSGGPVGLGNFWVDLTRSVLYVLLPLSLILAVVLASQGVVQSLGPSVPAQGFQGQSFLIPRGPAASQVAIKNLGTNGGGFFGPNAAFPFENPTPFSNFVELASMALIPAAFPFLLGRMTGRRRQGLVLFGVMLALLLLAFGAALVSELRWGTLEGKEHRFGISNSVLWAVLTTMTSCGAVNAMHDSLSPLSGMVALLGILLGEVVLGGVGSGLYGILALVVITVFVAGLMVGRGPEYLGKKIEAREVSLAMAAIIAPNLAVLALSALAVSLRAGLAGILNPGPHGLSELLYAYASAAGNNGSAFGGLGANTVFYNLTLGLGMVLGRYGVILPMLAVGGGMAAKRPIPESPGTFRTDSLLFAGLLAGVIVIVAGLTHFPALTLGPVLDHFLLIGGGAR